MAKLSSRLLAVAEHTDDSDHSSPVGANQLGAGVAVRRRSYMLVGMSLDTSQIWPSSKAWGLRTFLVSKTLGGDKALDTLV